MDLALLVKALGGFFAIMNPFVALPMFLTLTTGYDAARQRRTAVRVVLYSLVMAAVIMLGGSAVLGFFGISVNHFRVAGGIVLGSIALGMLNGGSSAHEGTAKENAGLTSHGQSKPGDADAEADVSFYPLTFPMLLGPGTITSIIVFTGQADGVPGLLSVAVALAVVLALLFIVLWFASAIGHRMSHTLRVIMTRLMGMILLAIAVEMVIVGLLALLPGLTG